MRSFSLENFQTILTQPVYWTVALRTVGMAALVTVTCAVLAFPIAYYMARVASATTPPAADRADPPATLVELHRQESSPGG